MRVQFKDICVGQTFYGDTARTQKYIKTGPGQRNNSHDNAKASRQDGSYIDCQMVYIENVNRRNADLPKNMKDVLVAKAAAAETLSLQDTLDDIASREASRQEQIGTGISNSMQKLPSNVDIKDVIAYMSILPNITKADAFAKFMEQYGDNVSKNGNFWLDAGNSTHLPVK